MDLEEFVMEMRKWGRCFAPTVYGESALWINLKKKHAFWYSLRFLHHHINNKWLSWRGKRARIFISKLTLFHDEDNNNNNNNNNGNNNNDDDNNNIWIMQRTGRIGYANFVGFWHCTRLKKWEKMKKVICTSTFWSDDSKYTTCHSSSHSTIATIIPYAMQFLQGYFPQFLMTVMPFVYIILHSPTLYNYSRKTPFVVHCGKWAKGWHYYHTGLVWREQRTNITPIICLRLSDIG